MAAGGDAPAFVAGEGPDSGAPFNCLGAIRHYLDKIIKPKDKDKEIQGMKALILDRETVSGVSLGACWRCSAFLIKPRTQPTPLDPLCNRFFTESNRKYGLYYVGNPRQRR